MPSARPEYEDEHRLFLQGIMAKGVLNNKEVHTLHEKVLKMCSIEIPEKRKDLIDLLASNIRTINNEIESVGLMIKKGVEEDTGESCFMLVNTQSRAVGGSKFLATKVQSQFSPAELDYLRLISNLFLYRIFPRLLATEILQNGEKMITSRAAPNLMDKVGWILIKKRKFTYLKKVLQIKRKFQINLMLQVGGGKKLSMADAEASIDKFFNCRWLKLVEDGCLTVDVRY